MMRIKNILLILSISGLISCNTANDRQEVSKAPGKSEMAELNRYLVQKDRERIQSYIERKELQMNESGSGLWYRIISEGTGDYFSDNDRIVMEYECYLLDGTRCYDSKESGPKEIILGRSGLESGLDQGLRMLKPGGKAMFILPPFLAHGIVGDGKKIPPRAVVVYNISVQLSVNLSDDR